MGWITACSPAWGSSRATPFVPPTVAGNITPPALLITTPTETPILQETPKPTASPPCSDNLTFLDDLTIPDNTQIAPGEKIDKQWLVQNSGTCNWDDSYHLKFISGSEMGAQAEQALFPARSGSELTIRILFTAPEEPGFYRSAWQAFNPKGDPFGDPFYIEIIIQSEQPSP